MDFLQNPGKNLKDFEWNLCQTLSNINFVCINIRPIHDTQISDNIILGHTVRKEEWKRDFVLRYLSDSKCIYLWRYCRLENVNQDANKIWPDGQTNWTTKKNKNRCVQLYLFKKQEKKKKNQRKEKEREILWDCIGFELGCKSWKNLMGMNEFFNYTIQHIYRWGWVNFYGTKKSPSRVATLDFWGRFKNFLPWNQSSILNSSSA